MQRTALPRVSPGPAQQGMRGLDAANYICWMEGTLFRARASVRCKYGVTALGRHDPAQTLLQDAGGDAAAPPAAPAAGVAILGGPGDGYRLAKRDTTDPVALLRSELLALLGGARWWEKDTDWLQVRAAPAARRLAISNYCGGVCSGSIPHGAAVRHLAISSHCCGARTG